MKNRENLQGFTLIEILIVIGLIAILAAVTIIALNPGQNFQDARDSERRSEIAQIISAFSQWYISDDGDAYNTLVLQTGTPIPSCNAALPTSVTNALNIWRETGTASVYDAIVPGYLANIPGDPQDETGNNTGYTVCHTGGNRITIFAPGAEGEFISVSR